jgi:tetratricopeptide (TPR) repeat protein
LYHVLTIEKMIFNAISHGFNHERNTLKHSKIVEDTRSILWGEIMDKGSLGSNDAVPLGHELVIKLEAPAVDLTYDENFLYAACRDQRVRVWSKTDWQLVAELGETDTPPLVVDVDDTQVFATCERRVYVWKKETWGMTGWFELSYQALTSALHGDYFYVGAREGRLVSIQKDTHETSSWQLHKSDITSLWSDDKIICTSTKKEEPRVWLKDYDTAPSELARLDKKGKGGVLSGNTEFVLVGNSTGEIAVYDRVEWGLVRTLESRSSNPVSSMWASSYYLVAAMANGSLTVWDLKRGEEIGAVSLNGQKIEWLNADHDLLYIATQDGITIIRLTASGRPLDVCSDSPPLLSDSLLKTSPYDVLEGALQLEKRADQHYQEGLFHESVLEYENALQILVDNTHALQEVPEERQILTDELNSRLGKALLKAKIQELQAIGHEIQQLSEELDVRKRTDRNPEDIERLWSSAGRTIKESHVLAEAQADDMLSYQLTHVVETLEKDLNEAMSKFDEFRETINQALALTRQISNEWRWMERRRTKLPERKQFLEGAMEKLGIALDKADTEGEVRQILSGALDEYRRLYSQIDRIVVSYDTEDVSQFTSKEEAKEAIDGLLSVMPKKIDALKDIDDPTEQDLEKKRIIAALDQALETAKTFKMNKASKAIQTELDKIIPQDKPTKSKKDN